MDDNKKFILAALVIMLGSNTGSLLNAYSPDFRADSFTGLDAAIMKEQLNEQHQIMREKISRLEWRVDDCMRKHKQMGVNQ